MIIAACLIAAGALALWSLTAWVMHALLTADPAHVGDIAALIDRISLVEGLSRWLPGWQIGVRLVSEILQSGSRWVGGVAPALLWILWVFGTTVWLGAAAVLSLLVTLLSSNRALPGPRGPAQFG